MTNHATLPAHQAGSTGDRARLLVNTGSAAGPLLVTLWAAQAVTRDGYDLTRHPMSLLALGELGWVQVLNFVATGALLVALGLGFGLLYVDGVGRTWIARLVQVAGVGLIVSGLFTADPGAGFPAGAPEGRPDYSWHGILHEVGFVTVMLSWTAAVVVLYRRARRERDRSLQRATLGTLLVVLAVSVVPHVGSFPVRTVLAAGLQLAFLAAVARRDLRRSVAP